MTILVTGGAGFIGSHIVDAYLAGGHQVVVVDNFWEHGGAKREHLDPRVRLIERDVTDPALIEVFREVRPEIVSHHAAQHSVAIGSRNAQASLPSFPALHS